MTDSARLNFPGAVALVMGGMIGTGIFLLPATLAPYGWNAVIGWIATIAGCVCLAYVIAALSRTHDRALGAAELIEHSFGRLAGFLVAFSYWVSCWTASATLAVGGTSYLTSFVPLLGAHPAWSSLGLIWLITLANLVSIRFVGQIQMVTMVLKLIPIVVVVALIAFVSSGGRAVVASTPPMTFSLGAINSAAAMAMFAMIGFEAACAAANKIDNPQRNVARATMLGATLTGLIYLVICAGIAFLLPSDQVANSPAPFSLFVATYWSPGPAAVIGLFAAISAIGCLNGWTLIQGEMLLEMAQRGMLPRWFARTTRNGISARGLIVSGLLASLLVISNSNRSMAGLFSFILLLATSVAIWFYLAVTVAAIKQRVVVPIAIIGFLYAFWALIGTGWDAALLGLVLMLAGLPLYWFARRESDRLLPAT